MQGPAWISLLRRIPAAQHDCVVLMTTTSAQIVLQRLISLENEFLVGMGRLAGSTEQGRMVVVPYDQLTYLSFNKKLADSDIDTILGKHGDATGEQTTKATTSAGEPDSPNMKLEEESSNPDSSNTSTPSADAKSPARGAGQEVAKPSPKSAMPSKSMLVARLRQRLADDAAKKPKP
jgi:hypothetical protein